MAQVNNRRSIIVGVFIFLGLVILIVGILTLGGQNKSFAKSVQVQAIFQDVAGLQRGNNVWFSGVKIGTVRRIQFHGGSQVAITMNIEESSQKYIHKDAKAKLSTDGLIGNKIIVITGGSANSDIIEDGDTMESEKALDTDAMMATLQENNKNLIDITGDFKIIGKRLVNGEGTIGTLLSDSMIAMRLRATLNNLNSITSNLKSASQKSDRVVQSFQSFASKLETKGGLANELVSDTVVFSNMKTVVDQLKLAADNATLITNNIRDVSGELTNKTKPIGLLMSDEATATQLSNTIKNLEAGTQKLDENMEALQHNFLLRGFFRRKARKQAQATADTTDTSTSK